MNRLGTVKMMVLAWIAAALLIAAPAAAAAPKSKTVTLSASGFSSFGVHGTNGWRVEVAANLNPRYTHHRNVTVYASRPDHETVDYLLRGRVERDGTVDAKLPGIGRIDVRFEPTGSNRTFTTPQKGCKLEGKPTDLIGYFRGTIELHGEGGYTSVERTSARGDVSVFPAQTCVKKKLPHLKQEEDLTPYYPTAMLFAGRPRGSGKLRFSAVKEDASKGPFGVISASTQFQVSYEHHRGPVTVVAGGAVEAGALASPRPHRSQGRRPKRRSRRPPPSPAARPSSSNRRRPRAGPATSASTSQPSARSV
jgi:hypothetical protein